MKDLFLYNAVKNDLRTGDLILWQAHNVIGRIIQLFTRSSISHASLVIRLAEYEGTERRRFTTEAVGSGVMLTLLSRKLEHGTVVWWYPLLDSWNDRRQEIGEKALSYIGVPYDFKSIFKFLFTEISADAKAIFCSELAFICYGFTGAAPAPDDLPRLGIFKDRVRIL